MGKHSTHEITQLLVAWNQGEQKDLKDLTVLLKQEQREKRGGGPLRVSLSAAAKLKSEQLTDLVALDDALQALEKLAPRPARVVELRFFAGLRFEEIADALEVSLGTVRRDSSLAEAWLFRELNREEQPR